MRLWSGWFRVVPIKAREMDRQALPNGKKKKKKTPNRSQFPITRAALEYERRGAKGFIPALALKSCEKTRRGENGMSVRELLLLSTARVVTLSAELCVQKQKGEAKTLKKWLHIFTKKKLQWTAANQKRSKKQFQGPLWKKKKTVAVLPLDTAGDTSISRPSQSGEGNFFSHSFQAGGQFVFCECGLKVYATRALFFFLAQLLSALPTIT